MKPAKSRFSLSSNKPVASNTESSVSRPAPVRDYFDDDDDDDNMNSLSSAVNAADEDDPLDSFM